MGVVAVIDVGSPKAGRLGWAFQRVDDPVETGSNLDEIIDRTGAALEVTSVALGFEAPLFVPYRNDAMTLTNARAGEGNRPWSAGPGATVTTTALAIVPYTLARLRELAPNAKANLDWRNYHPERRTLFLFEAFVSGLAKGTTHCDDAAIALQDFRTQACDGKFNSAIIEPSVLNLIGAALLRTGWTKDISVLEQDCLVLKADAPGAG